MLKRYLGKNGPLVSAMGMGCMGIAEFYEAGSEKEAINTIHAALDSGVTLLDTADMYGRGNSEQYVAKALKNRRDKVLLSTKFGFVRDDSNWNKMHLNGKPGYVKQACDASLRRLGTNHIDIYFLHRVDPEVPIEETIGAMADLVQQGKVGHLGLSDTSLDIIQRATRIHPIQAYQGEYSLWHREPELTLLPFCEQNGICFMPYSPLGRGFLTGKITATNQFAESDFRSVLPRFQPENFYKNLSMLEKFTVFATQKQCTNAQLALAWLLNKSPTIVPIPGPTRSDQALENFKAASIVLTQQEVEALSTIMPIGSAVGEAYPTTMQVK